MKNTAHRVYYPIDEKDHAVLLICPKEEELKGEALHYLTRLYCKSDPPCGVCPQCEKVKQGIHPDILYIKPEGASIKVDLARQITPFIAEKAYEGGRKSVLIEKAELMTTEAQNCLLKPVEEPPENTFFLLLARSENTVLSTISSRCKKIKIKPLPLQEAANEIHALTGTDEETARLYAALSDGYINEALRLLSDESFREVRMRTLEMCEKLCAAKNMGIQKHADFLEEQKENFALILKIILSFFYDLQWLKLTNAEDNIKNRDKAKELAIYSLNFTRSALSTIIDLLCKTEGMLRFALNYRLMIENMLFNILEVKNGKSNWRPF